MTTAALPDTSDQIAADESYLTYLREARKEGAKTKGIIRVQLPEGAMQEFRSLGSLNMAIAEVEARLNLARRRAEGHQFVGMTYR
ncbi:MAG: hypothetical protein OXE57_14790 [Alphaproteobacteria bacterium]|nr:hypothetical protein [Alphaproteobacteria bacterium]